MKRTKWIAVVVVAILMIAAASLTGCGPAAKSGSSSSSSGSTQQGTINVAGSDTMVNLAQAWAEAYAKVEPGVSVEVSGGGSGIGIAALLNGTCDLANSSRKLEDEEVKKATEKYGNPPVEHHVGYDALAIYVHPSNPMTEISIEQLGDIFRRELQRRRAPGPARTEQQNFNAAQFNAQIFAQ